MSDQEIAAGQAMPLRVTKRIVPFDEDTPSVEPLFINCAQAAFLGDDVYLDIGVITLDSLDPAGTQGSSGEFAVISRLVMSKRTAIALRDQIDFVLKREEKASANEASTIS